MNQSKNVHWTIWTLVDFIELEAGQHTIEVQAIGNGCSAVICGEVGPSIQSYAGGILQVIVISN